MKQAKKRYLVLENGSVFEGCAFGAEAEHSMGEVVFTTNMTGFTETATDPAFYGQIVVQTFPLIGNYGINPADVEGAPKLKGYIVKEMCQAPSHFACMGTFDTFLLENGIPGICEIDTRALTKLIRRAGQLRGVITDDPRSVDMAALKGCEIGDAVAAVTVRETVSCPVQNAKYNVAVWDFGHKASDVRRLNKLGCTVTIVPAHTSAAQVLAAKPDGVFLSAGPGDPARYPAIAAEIRKVCDAGVVVFGYGLGHQLLGLAHGGAVERLPYGHRGGYSVRDNALGRTDIMHQNHGYALSVDKLPAGAAVSFTNVNDGSCEGLDYSFGFSVQFEPGAAQFDRLISMMGGK